MPNLPYRKGVNAVVVDNNNNFLLVQKQNYGENQWDFPGGGLNENDESIEKDRKIAYAKHGKWYRGQEKHQFIVRFTGNKDDIKLQKEEIRRIKWVPYKKLNEHLVFEGQWENAKEVIKESGLDIISL